MIDKIDIDRDLLEKIKQLDRLSLYELDGYVRSLIGHPRVTYIQRPSKCGQPHCKKCGEKGKGHRSYWYAKFRIGKKQYMKYIGKEKKEFDVKKFIKRQGGK